MKVYTINAIEVDGKEVLRGSFIDISESIFPDLAGRVAHIRNGELRVPCFVESLEAIIVGLTSDDLALQKRLLLRHCQAFVSRNIATRWKEWKKLAAALELDEGISREEAEVGAARKLNLLAFMAEREAS